MRNIVMLIVGIICSFHQYTLAVTPQEKVAKFLQKIVAVQSDIAFLESIKQQLSFKVYPLESHAGIEHYTNYEKAIGIMQAACDYVININAVIASIKQKISLDDGRKLAEFFESGPLVMLQGAVRALPPRGGSAVWRNYKSRLTDIVAEVTGIIEKRLELMSKNKEAALERVQQVIEGNYAELFSEEQRREIDAQIAEINSNEEKLLQLREQVSREQQCIDGLCARRQEIEDEHKRFSDGLAQQREFQQQEFIARKAAEEQADLQKRQEFEAMVARKEKALLEERDRILREAIEKRKSLEREYAERQAELESLQQACLDDFGRTQEICLREKESLQLELAKLREEIPNLREQHQHWLEAATRLLPEHLSLYYQTIDQEPKPRFNFQFAEDKGFAAIKEQLSEAVKREIRAKLNLEPGNAECPELSVHIFEPKSGKVKMLFQFFFAGEVVRILYGDVLNESLVVHINKNGELERPNELLPVIEKVRTLLVDAQKRQQSVGASASAAAYNSAIEAAKPVVVLPSYPAVYVSAAPQPSAPPVPLGPPPAYRYPQQPLQYAQ